MVKHDPDIDASVERMKALARAEAEVRRAQGLCGNGLHPMTEANTRLELRRETNTVVKRCRKCAREADRRSAERRERERRRRPMPRRAIPWERLIEAQAMLVVDSDGLVGLVVPEARERT